MEKIECVSLEPDCYKAYLKKQKIYGWIILILSVVVIPFLDGDVTHLFIFLPLSFYLLFSKKIILYVKEVEQDERRDFGAALEYADERTADGASGKRSNGPENDILIQDRAL